MNKIRFLPKLSTILGLILIFAFFSVNSSQATICPCGSIDCYWNPEGSKCQPYYWLCPCAVACPGDNIK